MIRTLLTVFLIVVSYTFSFADAEKIKNLETKLSGAADTVKVNLLLDLATEYEYIDHKKAMDLANQAITLADQLNFASGEIRAHYEVAIISFLRGDRKIALASVEEGFDEALKTDHVLFVAAGYYHLSHYYEEESDFANALEYLSKAANIYEAENQQKRLSQCYSSYGGIYKTLGDYEQALNYMFKALSIKEAIHDQRGISIVFSNIGGVYLLTLKYAEARNYFIKALAIDRENDDQEGIAYNLTRLGVLNQKTNNFDIALVYFDSALTLSRHLNFRIDESILLGNIGSTLATQHKYEESLSYLFSALKLKTELDRVGSAAHSCNDICETYLYMENPREAKKFALQAIELATDVDIDQLRFGLYLLAECEYELGNYQSAYDHLMKSNVLKDSLFSNESEARMNELEVKYQTEKKEDEIQILLHEKQAAEFRRNTYIVAGLISLVFLFLLYHRQRYISRKNKQLLHKEQEIDRMKSRFFANISHEFRTPLTLILGPLEGMISKTNQVDDKKQLKVMRRNAGRLLDLVNQLLDLSKIESGKLKLSVFKSDIVGVIKGVSMSFHSLAEQKNISMLLDVPYSSMEMNYDKEKIETVLTNLLSNAFKFTPDGGNISIEAKIEKKAQNQGREYLKVVVADSGQGIYEDEVHMIFNRFYQSDSNELLQQEGSGIGLALAKEFVELHEGHISANSKLGEGTEIVFEIPTNLEATTSSTAVEKNIQDMPGDEMDSSDKLEELDAASEKELVLIIEDHEDVRNYIHEILKEKYQIFTAKDGNEGIEQALKILPDLIISDVMMPGRNGYEVCHTLKNDEKSSHIPLILLTAKSDTEDRIDGLQSMADDYITKPFNPRELLARVENLITSRKKLREKYAKIGVLNPSDIATNSLDEQFLSRLKNVVETQLGNEQFGVVQLSEELGMSRSQIHRKLKALLDQGPNQFIRGFRLQRAHDLLKQKAATASEIGYQVGFSSPSYFTKCFHEQFGYTPSEIPVNS